MNYLKAIPTKIIMILILCNISNLSAQVPKFLDYQSVIRDNEGKLMSNKSINIRFSLLNDDPNGTIEYIEEHKTTTNQFGLIYLYIGNGIPVQSNFNDIDWSKGQKYLRVEIDVNDNHTYTDLGTMQLVSVPFALYAEKSGMNFKTGSGIQIRNDSLVNTGDLNSSNEIQEISTTETGISLSNNGGKINFYGTGGTTVTTDGNSIIIYSSTPSAAGERNDVHEVQEQQSFETNVKNELVILRNENSELKKNYQTLTYQNEELQRQLNELKVLLINQK